MGRFGLDQAHSLDDLGERPRLSYSLDEACLLAFPRRDLSAGEAVAASHGRALSPGGIDGLYAATAPDGRVRSVPSNAIPAALPEPSATAVTAPSRAIATASS